MRFRLAARTDTGRVRNQNEDAWFADLPLVAVADGMGGHRGGEVASETALEVLKRWRDRLTGEPDAVGLLRQAFQEANETVWSKGHEDQRLEGMGTTLTAAVVGDGRLTLGHVGDSRAYLLRAGQLSQITEDQTLVREWEKQGRLTADEAAHSPQRNILLQAIGGDPATLDVDITTVEIRAGDRLLLASDGLHSMLADDDRLRDIMLANTDPDEACRALVDAANDAGGHDNITVVVVDALEDDPANPSAAPTAPTADDDAAPVDLEKTGEHFPVVVSKHPKAPEEAVSETRPEPAPRRRSRLVGIAIALTGALALVVAFFLVSASKTGLVVSARQGNVVVLDGRAGSEDRAATGEVVREFPDRLDTFPPPTQRQLRAGIPVDSLSEAERVVAGLPRILGPEQTPAPTPAATSSPTAPPTQTLPPPGSVP